MQEQHHVYNLIILDESGSMQSIKPFIINGFNELVETTQSVSASFPDQKHHVSLVSFNSGKIHTHLWNTKVSDIQKVSDSSYRPEGSTPLFDAIGSSIDKLLPELENQTNFNVLVTILTDGEENASRIYSGSALRSTIEKLEDKGWTFTYVGANHDVMRVASSLSIKHIMTFEANELDIHNMFEKEKLARIAFSNKLKDKTWHKDDKYYSDTTPE